MMPKGMITYISDKIPNLNQIYLEKDLYLQGLLLELDKNQEFVKSFVFKGGTCLTKAHFGYYRFSEDIDFTWLPKKSIADLSGKQFRKELSKEINVLLELFQQVAAILGLDFKPEKSNKDYVEFGSDNRFATFKFWYQPITTSGKTFIKIQISFVEKLLFPVVLLKVKPIAEKLEKELAFQYPAITSLQHNLQL